MNHRIGKDKKHAPTRIVGRTDPPTEPGQASMENNKTLKQNEEDIRKLDSDPVTKKADTEASNVGSQGEGFRSVQASIGQASKASSGPKTVYMKSLAQPAEDEAPAFLAQSSDDKSIPNNAIEGPVVGWLVITSGPGIGHSIAFSYGKNAVGRDQEQQIALSYGDEMISRDGHAFIEYDPRTRNCYLFKGSNLVYLNGSRVGSGAEASLAQGDVIELGQTQLTFVPFCGKEFSWPDE